MSRSSKRPPSPLITGKTPNQTAMIAALYSHPLVVAQGSAGTGKSFLAAAYAANFLDRRAVEKIIITRPAIPTGKSVGFFPGSQEEKMSPWVVPIMGTLKDCLQDDVDLCIKKGKIEIVPFETIRGRSFENAFVILDEAQNTTPEEMKAFVTRLGEGSTCVITGDTTQSDISKGNNGLAHLLALVQRTPSLEPFVKVINFSPDDIVRSGMCKEFVLAYQHVIY